LSNSSVSLPQGTRDFGPLESYRRTFIFNTLRNIFQLFGYQPLETPSMENLSTLTGKYGDEGDQLIYKILNSGDFFSKVDAEQKKEISSKALLPLISERALRYDLTVPFARYVVMNQNALTMPFKRYQIQPVWRADRPQKGRYREFYQCDVDLVGSASLVNEADLIQIYHRAFNELGIKEFTIRINNRKLLMALGELTSKPQDFSTLVIILDKLDKIGVEGVTKELLEKGFNEKDIETLAPFFELKGNHQEKIEILKAQLGSTEIGKKGLEELDKLFSLLELMPEVLGHCSIDILLARGLNYYTGTIMEVICPQAKGSLGGGGRYDDLTGNFGLKGITGVGISFGADRIYDLMKVLELFPNQPISTQVLVCNFFPEAEKRAFELAIQIRELGISTELYPDQNKLPKQLKYADSKNIPFVVLIGEEEYSRDQYSVKNMVETKQERFSRLDLFEYLKRELINKGE